MTRENWRQGLPVRASDQQAPLVADFQPVLLVILAKVAVRVGAVDWWPFLLQNDGSTVGVVAVADDREQHNALTIFHLLIDEREQRRGYGRAALTQIIELAHRTDGCHRVALTVNPRNHAAIRLYQSVGFEETGTDDDGELQMVRALRGAVQGSGRVSS